MTENMPISAELDGINISDIFSDFKARSIWYSGGGGAWDILEKKFLALILTKKINLLNGTVKKIICLQQCNPNSLIGWFETSKSKKISGSLRSPDY